MSKYYDKKKLPKTDEIITFKICTGVNKDYKEKYYDKCYECSDLVDKLKYITNEFIILKQRIDKSIEYIEKHKYLSPFNDCREPEEDWLYYLECNANDLLSILRGEDNE